MILHAILCTDSGMKSVGVGTNVVISQTHWLVSQVRLRLSAGAAPFILYTVVPSVEVVLNHSWCVTPHRSRHGYRSRYQTGVNHKDPLPFGIKMFQGNWTKMSDSSGSNCGKWNINSNAGQLSLVRNNCVRCLFSAKSRQQET